MKKIGHFDLHLLHYDEKIPSRISLLSLLARNKDNLDDLDQFRIEGQGDIITGKGKILGSTISSLAAGGSQIICSLGLGIKDTLSGVGDLDRAVIGSIGNATSQLVDSSTTGLAKIISSLRGISTVILGGLILLIYVYLFMMQSVTNANAHRAPDLPSVGV